MVDIGITDRLGALVARGLDLGFDVVQIRRAEAFRPGTLLLGYEDEDGILAFDIDEARLGGGAGDKAAVSYRAELLERIGRVALGVPELPASVVVGLIEGDPIETLARDFLNLHALVEHLNEIKAHLLGRMQAQGRTAIDVPGLGAVMLQPATTQHPVDVDRTRALVDKLVDELRAHGVNFDVIDLPRKEKAISASLRVQRAT